MIALRANTTLNDFEKACMDINAVLYFTKPYFDGFYHIGLLGQQDL
jgi:hypothetical protein